MSQQVGGREPGGRDEGDSRGAVHRVGGESREKEGAAVGRALCALPDNPHAAWIKVSFINNPWEEGLHNDSWKGPKQGTHRQGSSVPRYENFLYLLDDGSWMFPEWLREAFWRSLKPESGIHEKHGQLPPLRLPVPGAGGRPCPHTSSVGSCLWEKQSRWETANITSCKYFLFYFSDFGPVFELMHSHLVRRL